MDPTIPKFNFRIAFLSSTRPLLHPFIVLLLSSQWSTKGKLLVWIWSCVLLGPDLVPSLWSFQRNHLRAIPSAYLAVLCVIRDLFTCSYLPVRWLKALTIKGGVDQLIYLNRVDDAGEIYLPCRGFHIDLGAREKAYLLSSSMDKTVRLWHMSSNSCLKTFSHSDYVTCIQFNPINDNYFISGSLDEKVRIWSIPDRQIVDWTDLHEMALVEAEEEKQKLECSGNEEANMYDLDNI